MLEHQRQPLTAYYLCGLAVAGSTGERRSHLGTESPGSPTASAAEAGVVPGSPRDHPVLWSSARRSLPEVKECQQGSRRCSGTACGAPDRLPGRRCISRLREKSASEFTAAPGKGSAGQQRTRPGRGSRGPAGRCPAPPGTHRRGCRNPSGGTWCAVLLRRWRLSQRRGPSALSGAFIGSRQLHALLRGRRRGGE